MGLGMLTQMFNKLACCTVAVRDDLHPPEKRRDDDAGIPLRSIGLFIVAADGTVEHVAVKYENPSSHPSGVQESVAIRGGVYEAGLGIEMKARRSTLLTPDWVHDVVYGPSSVGVLEVDGGDGTIVKPIPPGAAVGKFATLYSSKPSLLNAIRLESYSAPRAQWTVQPMRWNTSQKMWVVNPKKGTRTVAAVDVCIDRVHVEGLPDLWKTSFETGASFDDVALMAYCTLPMRQRYMTRITIHQGEKDRVFALPEEGIIPLPTPPAPFRMAELAEALRADGLQVQVLSPPTTAEIAETVNFVRAIDMKPSSTVVLVGRPSDHARAGFRAMQGILSGAYGKPVPEAAWLGFRGGDRREGESMWVAGRPCHDLNAARRMVNGMTEESECAICLEPLIDGAALPLKCGHNFHLQCMMDVSKSDAAEEEGGVVHQSCSLCRTPFRMDFMTTSQGLSHYEDRDEFQASQRWLYQKLHLS